jgi:hypothetical protein
MLIVSNLSDKPQRIRSIANSWGECAISFDVFDRIGKKLGSICNTNQVSGTDAPVFDTILPGECQVFPIRMDAPLGPKGETLVNLPIGIWHRVRMRAIYASKAAENNDIWTGTAHSKLYEYQIRFGPINDNAAKLHRPPPHGPVIPQKPQGPRFPDGFYAVNPEWFGKKQNLEIHVKDNEAKVIQSTDPSMADMNATFRADDDGAFHIFFQGKDNRGGSQHWLPQGDGSFIIKEVPDRGEQQKAIPIQKNL